MSLPLQIPLRIALYLFRCLLFLPPAIFISSEEWKRKEKEEESEN